MRSNDPPSPTPSTTTASHSAHATRSLVRDRPVHPPLEVGLSNWSRLAPIPEAVDRGGGHGRAPGRAVRVQPRPRRGEVERRPRRARTRGLRPLRPRAVRRAQPRDGSAALRAGRAPRALGAVRGGAQDGARPTGRARARVVGRRAAAVPPLGPHARGVEDAAWARLGVRQRLRGWKRRVEQRGAVQRRQHLRPRRSAACRCSGGGGGRARCAPNDTKARRRATPSAPRRERGSRVEAPHLAPNNLSALLDFLLLRGPLLRRDVPSHRATAPRFSLSSLSRFTLKALLSENKEQVLAGRD